MSVDEAVFNLGMQFGEDYSFHGFIPLDSLEVTGSAGGVIKFPLQEKDADSVIFEKLSQASALKNIILYVSLKNMSRSQRQNNLIAATVDAFYYQLHKDSTLPKNAAGLLRLRAGTSVRRGSFESGIELKGKITFKQSPYIVGQNPKLIKLEINLQSPTVGWF